MRKGPHSWDSNGRLRTQLHVCIYHKEALSCLLFHLPVIIVIKPNSSSQTGGEISAPPHPAWRKSLEQEREQGEQAQRREGSFPTPR